MASGPVQKVGFTVISTSATEGVLVTTPRGTTSIAAPVTEALNEALGGRQVFNASAEAETRPEATTVKGIDGYAAAFLSSYKGAAIFGDLGLDLIKLESKMVDLGLGFRLDTGINVGTKGVRVCFAGMGGEIVLSEDDTKTFLERVEGFGFEAWIIKMKAVFER